jgi:hypothetical protein
MSNQGTEQAQTSKPTLYDKFREEKKALWSHSFDELRNLVDKVGRDKPDTKALFASFQVTKTAMSAFQADPDNQELYETALARVKETAALEHAYFAAHP